jgi:hypothetical protein
MPFLLACHKPKNIEDEIPLAQKAAIAQVKNLGGMRLALVNWVRTPIVLPQSPEPVARFMIPNLQTARNAQATRNGVLTLAAVIDITRRVPRWNLLPSKANSGKQESPCPADLRSVFTPEFWVD